MKKRKFRADLIVGLSAMLISLMTLFIILYQTNLQKQQSRLSVRPRLTFSKHIDRTISIKGEGAEADTSTMVKMRLTIRNNGLGPAIIDYSEVLDPNGVHALRGYFNEAYPKMKRLGFFNQISDLSEGESLPASESKDLITYQYDERYERELLDYLGVDEPYELPFSIRVVYASMYEEKWRVESNKEGHPERLD